MRDSRKDLESLGFVVIKANGLFYRVAPPQGFTRFTEGDWTDVKDASGKYVFTQQIPDGCDAPAVVYFRCPVIS